MFRQRVAEHYRQRGYQVQEDARIRGASGAVHACGLVVQGPLGNLVVDFAGADGPDDIALGSVRRKARDVGASPVLAAPRVRPPIQHAAGRLGVALLDETALEENPPLDASAGEADDPLTGHPWPEHARKEAVGAWPASGRRATAQAAASAAGSLWRAPLEGAAARTQTPVHGSDSRAPETEPAGPDLERPRPPAQPPQEPTDEPFGWLRAAATPARGSTTASGYGAAVPARSPGPASDSPTALLVEEPRTRQDPSRPGGQDPQDSPAPAVTRPRPTDVGVQDDPLGSDLRSVLESRKRPPPPTIPADPAEEQEPEAPVLEPEAEQSATLRSRTRRPARLARRRPQVPITRAQAIQAAVWGAAAGTAGGATFWLLSLLL